MISTSLLNKKKIYYVWCTPLFELGWNDPVVVNSFYCQQLLDNLPVVFQGMGQYVLLLLDI